MNIVICEYQNKKNKNYFLIFLKLKDLSKTNAAVKLLKELKAYQDVSRSKESTKIRAGKGKMRNRRYVTRRGPLVVYDTNDHIELVGFWGTNRGFLLCLIL